MTHSRFNKLFGWVFLLVAGLSASDGLAESIVIEDFEAYRDGQIVGGSAVSRPWRRFGVATTDNIVATNRGEKILSGRLSGQYGLFWPNTFGSARLVFEVPADLSSYTAASVAVKSTVPQTTTSIVLAVSNGPTTYHAAVPRAVTDQPQVFTFDLREANMVLVDGNEPYQIVISQVDNIGFTFQSREGQYAETMLLDDLTLMWGKPTAATEPARPVEIPAESEPKAKAVPEPEPVSESESEPVSEPASQPVADPEDAAAGGSVIEEEPVSDAEPAPESDPKSDPKSDSKPEG